MPLSRVGRRMPLISYARHQFPPVVIQHAVWLYLRFTLSYRDVEELLAERGLEASYETIRRWVLKFGTVFARRLRARRPRPSSRWHLDEMVAVIGGRRIYLWRAVDDEGEVLDILVQKRRDKAAAVRLMRRAAQEARLCTERDRDRQVAVLWRCPDCDRAISPSRARPAQEQPGGKLAPAGPEARAEAAAIQVARLGPALPLCSFFRLQPSTFNVTSSRVELCGS